MDTVRKSWGWDGLVGRRVDGGTMVGRRESGRGKRIWVFGELDGGYSDYGTARLRHWRFVVSWEEGLGISTLCRVREMTIRLCGVVNRSLACKI